MITLPSEFNDSHEHAVLKDKGQKGIRYAWNCKCVDDIYHALNSQAPKVWDCHAGKKYPKDAIYVGCRVRNRKGGVIRKGTFFGNGDDPLKSHHGWKKTDQEFRQEAVRRMSGGFAGLSAERFRKEVEALRGKDLLCWCKQDGPKRATFCHARVWLELANQREVAQ